MARKDRFPIFLETAWTGGSQVQSADYAAQLAGLDREAIENAIREIHRLRAHARFEALERYLAPGAVFEFVGNTSDFPYAGRYNGRKAIVNLYKRINTEIEMLDSRLLERFIDGNRAFSRRLVDVRHRGTGLREMHEIWDIWEFNGGLVQYSLKMIDTGAYGRLQGG